MPGVFPVTYQGSESSTSEGIHLIFEKAKKILATYSKNNANNTVIPLIVFDEMGLAEISKNNPLKVLHSLLEVDNVDISFVGISNWRLDASKMNRGIFLARPDLTKEDLENTAEVIFKSYIDKENQNTDYKREIEIVKILAEAYFSYKEKLKKTKYPEFHGARDFYYLIKQVSEKFTNKRIQNNDEILSIIQIALERNFEGLKENVCSIKQEFRNCFKKLQEFDKKISTLDLIKMNLNDKNSRYLMLIIKSDSAAFILDNFLSKNVKNRITFVGSKFEDDLNKEEYSFRTLSDVILYMEKGWAIIMQDMDHIYSSLYDLFNQNFTITGGNKKNCRIALGSVINPLCFVHDEFHCIIMVQEEMLSRCEPPFLNRFEKYFLSFETIITDERLKIMKSISTWIENLLNIDEKNKQHKSIKMSNLIANYTDETVASLIFYYFNKENKSDDEQRENVTRNCKQALTKICSNFSLLMATQSRMAKENEDEMKLFVQVYSQIFDKIPNLNSYLKEKSNEAFKSIVYTFDSVTKKLNLDNIQYEETKIGFFNSEKSLHQKITKFYKSSEQLLIIRIDWEEQAQHLSLLKFLIDKIELDNAAKLANKKKSICIIIHLNFISDEETDRMLNKYKLSFLSGFDQIMLDNLDDKTIGISEILFLPIDELIVNEKIVKFDEINYDLIVNSINKFKYVEDNVQEKKEEFNKKIYEYKRSLVKNFASNNKTYNELTAILKNKIFENIKKGDFDAEFKDWRLQILVDNSMLQLTFDIKRMLKHLINNKIMYPYLQFFYQIEKFFPFDCLMNNTDTHDDDVQNRIFFDVINDELRDDNRINVKNANQANEIIAKFGLKLPFIIKEYEIFQKVPEIEKSIDQIISIERTLEGEDINNQKKNKIRDLATFCKETVRAKSFYFKYINEDNKENIFESYLQDMVRIKYQNYFGTQKNVFDFLMKLVRVAINKNDDEFDISSIYFYTIKLFSFVQKLIDIFKSFKSLFSDEISQQIIMKLVEINLHENVKQIETKLIETLVNTVFEELLQQIDKIDLQHFSKLFIELISLKIQYGFTVKIYNVSFFMNELAKLLLKLNKKTPEEANKLAKEVVTIIREKIENNEFLKDSDCIEQIMKVINMNVDIYAQLDTDKNDDKDEIGKFENFLFGLALEENKDKAILSVFFDQSCEHEYSVRSAGPILEKLLKNITIDIDLNFLIVEDETSSFLEILNEKFVKIGLDSELAIIVVQVLYNNLEFDEEPEDNFEDFVTNNESKIFNLYEVLQNFEFGFENKLIKDIKCKNIAYLSSIAFLKRITLVYCQELLNNAESENTAYMRVFNEILCDNKSSMSNSLSILALRIINQTKGSYYALKEFICSNLQLKWRVKLKFGEPKGLLDICLYSDKLGYKIKENGNLVSEIINCNDVDKAKEYRNKITALNRSEDDSLTFLLSSLNNIYSSNTHSEFFEIDKSKFFKDYFKSNIINTLKKDNLYFNSLLTNIVNNFPTRKWFQAGPTMNINDLKLLSIILHFSSVIASFSKQKNSFTYLFSEKDGDQMKNLNSIKALYWLTTPDDEEFEILNSLKNLEFKSFSDEDIAQNRWDGSKGFGLYSKLNV